MVYEKTVLGCNAFTSTQRSLHFKEQELLLRLNGSRSNEDVGLMGRTIKERIAICNDEVNLKNCLSTWHMAMRESKLGRASTDFLMEQIHQILVGNMTDAGNHMH